MYVHIYIYMLTGDPEIYLDHGPYAAFFVGSALDIYIYIWSPPPPHELPRAVLYGKTQEKHIFFKNRICLMFLCDIQKSVFKTKQKHWKNSYF